MGDYPPKLVRVVATTFGSLLSLNDGREVPIDIRPDQLNRALVDFGRPPLDELVASRALGVFVGLWEFSDRDWDRTRAAVRASPEAAAAFGDVPAVWETFGQPADVVRGFPHRVYGGLDWAVYTSHPFAFGPDPNRPRPWVRGLVSAPGGRLFNTWVNLRDGRVEIKAGVQVGHYVE